jgi:hypothetical protein
MTYYADYLDKDPTTLSDKERRQAISKHYNSIASIVDSFVSKKLSKRGLIVNGPAGGGKTEVVRQSLDVIGANYHLLKGTLSAPELFIRIHNHAKNPNQILVIDDTDICFDDVEMSDILKAALDPNSGNMYYGKKSHYLISMGVPQEFKCEGRIILITNKPLKTTFMTARTQQRIKPILDRCLYVPAGLNDNWTAVAMNLLHQVGRVRILANSGLSDSEQNEIIEFITKNYKRFNGLSFRSIQTCIDMRRIDSNNWRDLVMMSEGR